MKKENYLSFILTVLIALMLNSIGISQEKITKSFQVKKGGELSVKVAGSVKIISWGKDEVYIEVMGLDKDEVENLNMEQDGNNVSIYLRGNSNASFLIQTPDQFNLYIKTSGGDLICSGKVIGNVNGTTAGGDVMVQNVNGDVSLTTAGGDVKTGDISGFVKLTTAGGDIMTGKIGGEGKLTTAGGDIIVESAAKTLSVSTAGGDIKVKHAGDEIKLSTSGGDILVGQIKGSAKLNTSGGDIKLAGASGRVSSNTSGGDIRLESVYGSVNANTSGGEVYVELTPDGSDESKLNSSGGNLKLLVPESAKATIEAVIKVSSRKDLKNVYKIFSDFKFDSYVADDDEREIKAKISLNGGGKLISLRTSSSNITIGKLNK